MCVNVLGFQKTEEPSSAHLAVLHSASSHKPRTVTTNNPKQNKSSVSSTSSKSKTNGHVPTANGVAKKVAKVEVNKENKPPQQPKIQVKKEKENVRDPANKPDDFESGKFIRVFCLHNES